MESSAGNPAGTTTPIERGAYELGVGPPLSVDDLPTPEEAFGTPRIALKETITLVIGPSLIALGLSVGSGEWILAPLAIGTEGWVGIGFVALISILLQALYNVEIGRYVLATGEVPSIGFGRIPPGFYLGTILAVLLFYLAFITGGWAAGAGDALFTFLTGDIPGEEDATESNWLAVLLMAVVFVITLFGRKISRTLELVNWVLVVFILTTRHARGRAPGQRERLGRRPGGTLPPGAAALRGGCDGHRRRRGLRGDGLRPELRVHELLPRQGLRHGHQGGLHPRAARRREARGRRGRLDVPRDARERRAVAAVVPVPAARDVDRVRARAR